MRKDCYNCSRFNCSHVMIDGCGSCTEENVKQRRWVHSHGCGKWLGENDYVPKVKHPHTHVLKIHPPYFDHIVEGKKTFEFRIWDRDYKVGDKLSLIEYSPFFGYTGRCLICQITYILEGDMAPEGRCLMSIKLHSIGKIAQGRYLG